MHKERGDSGCNIVFSDVHNQVINGLYAFAKTLNPDKILSSKALYDKINLIKPIIPRRMT